MEDSFNNAHSDLAASSSSVCPDSLTYDVAPDGVSLAYGIEELDRHRSLADELIDPAAEVGWRLGLWERVGETWSLQAGG